MNKRYPPFLPSALLSLAMLAGCMPDPGAHEILLISADGQYQLDGRPVAREQLAQVLAGERQRLQDLLVEVRPSPQASLDAVKFSIQAVKSAHARLAFTHDESRS